MRQQDFPNYEDHRLTLDCQRQRVWLHGRAIEFTHKEFLLLAMLASRADTVVTRGALLRRVWGYPENHPTRTLDVHVRRVRKKLGDSPEPFIETVFRSGYRFVRQAPDRGFIHPIGRSA